MKKAIATITNQENDIMTIYYNGTHEESLQKTITLWKKPDILRNLWKMRSKPR